MTGYECLKVTSYAKKLTKLELVEMTLKFLGMALVLFLSRTERTASNAMLLTLENHKNYLL